MTRVVNGRTEVVLYYQPLSTTHQPNIIEMVFEINHFLLIAHQAGTIENFNMMLHTECERNLVTRKANNTSIRIRPLKAKATTT